MERVHQLLFIVCLLALCWLAMMAVHELGHVVWSLLTGGTVERVVLHPLAISRTDVSPNPHPSIVVWLGPLIGCLLPLIVALSIPSRAATARNVALFFSGFCLITNGAYIGFGSLEGVGDAGVMLRTGSSIWLLLAFGGAAIGLGLFTWHRMGSPREFLSDPTIVTKGTAYAMLLALIVLVVVEWILSPR